MAYDMTIIERLERDLNDRDATIEKLQEKIDGMEAYATWEWARHTTIEAEDDPLPVPRLEMSVYARTDDWYITEWLYSLVYKHLLGHHVRIPLGHTKVTGGRGGPPDPDFTPIRDGAHIRNEARQMGLPAYVVIEGRATQLDVSDRRR